MNSQQTEAESSEEPYLKKVDNTSNGQASNANHDSDAIPAIEIRGLYKVFGNHVKRALALSEQGKSKQDILQETGAVLALKTPTLKSTNAKFSL